MAGSHLGLLQLERPPPPQRGGQGKALLEVRVSPFLRGAHAVSRLRTARPTQDTGRGRAHGGRSFVKRGGGSCLVKRGGGACLIYPATPDAGSPPGVTSSRIQGRRGRRLGFRFASSCTPLSPLDKGTVWQSGSKRTSLPPARIHVASRKESGARGGGTGQLEYS